jgi:hypothetical protein
VTPLTEPFGTFSIWFSRPSSLITVIDFPEIASPQTLSLGKLALSTKSVFIPCFDKKLAQELPLGPAPTTTTSNSCIFFPLLNGFLKNELAKSFNKVLF